MLKDTAFRKFLESKHCDENLDFICDVKHYEKFVYNKLAHRTDDLASLSEKEQDQCISKILVFIDKYLLPSSTSEINIPETIRNPLTDALWDKNYHPKVFNNAKKHVNILLKDSYNSFIRSKPRDDAHS